MTHGLSTVWLISLALSGDKLSGFLCHFDSRPCVIVPHYSAETNTDISNGSKQCDTPKTKEVPEVEASVDERLSANGSQKRTLSKSRENETLTESQAVSAWAKIHTLPSPPLLLVFPPSLSRTLKLSGSEKLHGWPPSLTGLMPVSQKLSETPEDQKLQKIADKVEPEHSSKLPCQSLSMASSTLLRASERIQPVFPNFALTQARKGVVFSRVGSEWFLSWSHYSVAV